MLKLAELIVCPERFFWGCFMKSRLNLTCILWFAIFVSKISLATALEMSAFEQPTSIHEVQEYTAHIADTISHVAESILSISPEQHTYENTLRPWNQLCVLLSQHIHTLNSIAESDLISNRTASHALGDLKAFLSQTLNFHDLPQILAACSQKILEAHLSTPFQRHIATRFINNSWQESLGLLHPTQEKTTPDLEHAITDLGYTNFIEMPEANVAYIPKSFIEEAYNVQKDPQQGIMNRQFASVLDGFNILPIRSHRDRDDDKKDGASGEVGGRYKYGPDGGKWSIYGEVEAHDKNGNYVKGDVEKNQDGGEWGVAGGKKSK